MESESHLDTFVVFDSVLEVFVVFIFQKSVGFGDLSNHLDKGKYGQVSHLLDSLCFNEFKLFSIFLIFKLSVSLLVFPNQQKGITDVLVWWATVRVYDGVTDLSNLIDEDHDFGFKDFSGICEISDIAEAVNTENFLTRDDDVHELRVLDNFGDDFGTGLPESYCKKASNFYNKIF